MIVYMVHDKHGRMPCYNANEVANAKLHGWREEAQLKLDATIIVEPEKRKPGRPRKGEQ